MEKISEKRVAEAMSIIRQRSYQDSLERTDEELERHVLNTLETIANFLQENGLRYPGTLSNLAFNLVFNASALNAKKMNL